MNYRIRVGVSLLALAVVGCGGGFSQEDLDAAVQAALATTLTTGAPEATTSSTSAPTTTTQVPTPTTTRPLTTTTVLPDLEASDFIATIDVLESSCFGSAGANVEFEVLWGWDGEAHGTLTYEISGLDDGAVDISTTEIVGTEFYVNSHFVGIPSCDPALITVVPTRFRAGR